MENILNPDQMADLDLQCFHKKIYPGLAGHGLTQ